MRGRKPAPTQLKIVAGVAKSRINQNEPKPRVGAKRPAWLSPKARKHWPKIAPMLEELGVLTEADAPALALFCEAFSRWKEAESQLDGPASLVERTQMGIRTSPYVQISKIAREEMLRILVEFGMTPSSRTRVSRITVPDGDEKPTTGLASFRRKSV